MQLVPMQPILFFDGVCILCNRWVDRVLKLDTQERFKFAPLQGETARQRLTQDHRESLPSIILLEGERVWSQSDAILRLLFLLGGWWRLTLIFRIVPRPLRDALYQIVAKRRYRWFGQRKTCRLPSVDEKARFLD